MTAQKIAIIGGGVIGMAVARALALQGAQVTLFEQQHLGAGTSSTSFAWLNSNGKQPDSYHQLNALAMEEHVRLQLSQPNGLRWLETCGTWEWASDSDQHALKQRAERLQALGYPAREVTFNELQREVPELRSTAVSGSLWHFPSESILYPSLYLARLWADARSSGAVLHQQCRVTDVQESATEVRLRLDDGGQWRGDRLVVASGRWSAEVMQHLGLQLAMTDASQPNKVACSFLARTAPQPLSLATNLITPQLNVRPDGGGRLLLQALDLDDQADPAAPPAVDSAIAQQMQARYRELFDDAGSLHIEQIVVGQRARPADGLPALGFVTPQQRVYLAVMHSGMTLSPLIGRLLAEELGSDTPSPLLRDFRPQRLLGKTAADFPTPVHYFPAAQ
ncbi:NAD(P)/FAD-dependent oxidoreductase [Pantoea phytobeneficialis]|uniref:FAD-binding oxidoreductase n=1 Tax=Pantoea phytobeneficialis TaxID=2052056 RepID=A0AAP9KRF1_9GAMM|nr:FAD-binding oxidoreductase [Pantoea phytobeneficialis]MDO6409430.1 FAD-binding oxidoreductase [Pantoea phytobeneficialis]QGR08923.1 FAD-dependent oxidoreductase [Pantoea phytobeneficialis]